MTKTSSVWEAISSDGLNEIIFTNLISQKLQKKFTLYHPVSPLNAKNKMRHCSNGNRSCLLAMTSSPPVHSLGHTLALTNRVKPRGPREGERQQPEEEAQSDDVRARFTDGPLPSLPCVGRIICVQLSRGQCSCSCSCGRVCSPASTALRARDAARADARGGF